jgi:hypothetical protein
MLLLHGMAEQASCLGVRECVTQSDVCSTQALFLLVFPGPHLSPFRSTTSWCLVPTTVAQLSSAVPLFFLPQAEFDFFVEKEEENWN